MRHETLAEFEHDGTYACRLSITAAAIGMTVGSSGMVNLKTTVLLTPEEIDRASTVHATYTPPGS